MSTTMLGGVVNDIYLPGWYQHHETREMPNGNLLVSVDKIGESTVEDHILEVTLRVVFAGMGYAPYS